MKTCVFQISQYMAHPIAEDDTKCNVAGNAKLVIEEIQKEIEADINNGMINNNNNNNNNNTSSNNANNNKANIISSSEIPKMATRSRRLAKPRKEFDSSPSSKKQSKEEKPVDVVVDNNMTKKRVLWSFEDKNLFFEALLEHGKDFDAIQNFMGQKFKKRQEGELNVKSKDQIRHFYYRTWHKISPFIKQSTCDETKKQTIELQGVLCYGELRKKIVAKFDEKLGHKLNEMVHKGSTILRVKGKKFVVRAPSYKSIKKHHHHHHHHGESSYQIKMLPEKVSIELTPRNNKSWSFVQSLSQNPRVSILVRLNNSISSLIIFLQHKWSQMEGESKMKLKVYLPSNVQLCPQNVITSEPQLSNLRIVKSKSDPQSSESNLSENKALSSLIGGENVATCVDAPSGGLVSDDGQMGGGDKGKRVVPQSDSNDDEDDDSDRHCDVDMSVVETDDDKKSKENIDKKFEDRENIKHEQVDEISKKLLNGGLDELTGSHMSVAKLLALLSCPDVIKLEYDFSESTNRVICNNDGSYNCPMDVANASTPTYTSSISSLLSTSSVTSSSSLLNSRIRRLLEIACTEYYAAEQKIKDQKLDEPKNVSSSTTAAMATVAKGDAVASSSEMFRVPESMPPRMSQSVLRNNEKRIVDQDLLQQMPIFQKKPEMFLSRRCRKRTIQKPPPPPNFERPLLPKINISDGQSGVISISQSSNLSSTSLMGFSSITLHTSTISSPSMLLSTSLSSSSPSQLSSKPSFIIMEPSELKPSVRRIVPITLNKTPNSDPSSPLTSQSLTIAKAITGTDVFLMDTIFEDSNNTSNHNSTHNNVSSATSDALKVSESVLSNRQPSVDDQWLNNEELSLTSFFQDVPLSAAQSINPSSGFNLLHHFFLSESSRESSLLSKFDVDTTLQCLMNESSLDFASRFADIAAQLSTSSSSSTAAMFQSPSSSLPLNSSTLSLPTSSSLTVSSSPTSLLSTKLIT